MAMKKTGTQGGAKPKLKKDTLRDLDAKGKGNKVKGGGAKRLQPCAGSTGN